MRNQCLQGGSISWHFLVDFHSGGLGSWSLQEGNQFLLDGQGSLVLFNLGSVLSIGNNQDVL